MKKKVTLLKIQSSLPAKPGFDSLLGELRNLIAQARQQALRAVDLVQVRTCWEVGRHIVEFEQGGQARAEYGAGLLVQVAARLTEEFGKGFDASNLYKMTQFYRLFENLDALSLKLSWTHYRQLLRVDDSHAREWYCNEAASQNWSTRQLERQIGTLYYVRLYDDQRRGPEDNPTVGIILCANKDETVVRYSVLHGNEKLFATKYKLILPSEAELREELERELEVFRQQKLLHAAASPNIPSPKKPGRNKSPQNSDRKNP